MVAANLVERILHPGDLQAYRRRLLQELERQAIFRLLPALVDLPLELIDAQGAPQRLADMLRLGGHVSLIGTPGSGRRLALLQVARRWAIGGLPDLPPPVLFDLASIDDGSIAPDELLTAALAPARPAEPPARRREPLAIFRRRLAGDEPAPPAHLLLIHGWEELAPARREAWRSALQQAADPDAPAHLLIALPADEPRWPNFAALAPAPIGPALCASWVEHLAPAESRPAIMSALAPGGALHPLGERLFDIALLCRFAPEFGLPGTRAELYARALATVLDLPIDQLGQARLVSELQLLAAYDEPAPVVNTDLLIRGQRGRARFVHAQVRRYMAARQLVAEQGYDLLAQLEPAECAELAPLIATMIDDPTPLYAALWQQARLHPAAIQTLARCLRERAPRSSTWTLRVVAALAQQQGHEDPVVRGQAEQLLEGCMPALDACLPAAARADAPIQRFLIQLFELLPAELSLPRVTQLILSAETPEPFAWELTDRLVEGGAADYAAAPPRFSPAALARWIYIQAITQPASCRQIDAPTIVAALHALAESGAGESRKLFVASALVEDTAQPAAARLAALDLLVGSSQPTAHTIVERVCGDADPAIRRRALGLLSRLDPERAAVALGRTAMDSAAGWELRLAAIRHLGETKPRGAERLLWHCAQDRALPLFARLKAIGALAGTTEGAPRLASLLGDTNQHPVLRAAAADGLGAAGYAAALPSLMRLIDDPHTPDLVLAGACRGLSALRDRAAVGPLVRRLGESGADVTLTLAALHALGQIGDPDTSASISPLLGGEALHRLQRAATPELLDRPVDDCLGDPALPPPIGERLARALASSPTEDNRPTTLAEFLIGEADRVRAAAARALAAIGGSAAQAALMAALLDDTAGGATADIIAALAELEGDESASSLSYLLNAPEVNPLTHWLVARQLTSHPAGEPVMLRALQNPALDAFTRGALAEGLGQRHALSALTPLRLLAEQTEHDNHLRSQALLGLGLLDDPTTETILIRQIGDPSEDLTLRGLAAEYLPAGLSPEGRRFLRELLRAEQTPDPLAIGALRTLGRVRDREALPHMLRYCHSVSAEVGQAAIDALADLGDGSVAPVLVRIAHQQNADHALRLQAVSALLRIGGDGYLPLLKNYLHQGALPFRMLALEALLSSRATAADLLPILSSPSWPVAMRLRLIDYFAGDTAAAPALIDLLEASADQPQLRILAAEVLSRLHYTDAAPALIRQAEHAAAPVALRLACVAALHKLNDATSWAALSRLAEDASQPPLLRDHAQRALCDVISAQHIAGLS
jgi:HEAT repeat protein